MNASSYLLKQSILAAAHILAPANNSCERSAVQYITDAFTLTSTVSWFFARGALRKARAHALASCAHFRGCTRNLVHDELASRLSLLDNFVPEEPANCKFSFLERK
jgi:hypothetical protein